MPWALSTISAERVTWLHSTSKLILAGREQQKQSVWVRSPNPISVIQISIYMVCIAIRCVFLLVHLDLLCYIIFSRTRRLRPMMKHDSSWYLDLLNTKRVHQGIHLSNVPNYWGCISTLDWIPYCRDQQGNPYSKICDLCVIWRRVKTSRQWRVHHDVSCGFAVTSVAVLSWRQWQVYHDDSGGFTKLYEYSGRL